MEKLAHDYIYPHLCLTAVSDAINKHKEAFPGKEDFEGAITALLRLQDTYQLQPSSFALGKLPGSVQSPKMTVGEVYDVGRHAYLNSDMFYTKTWMEEALKQYNKQNESEDVRLFDMYDHLAFSEYKVRKKLKLIHFVAIKCFVVYHKQTKRVSGTCMYGCHLFLMFITGFIMSTSLMIKNRTFKS